MNYKVIFSQDRIGKLKNRVILDLMENKDSIKHNLLFLANFVMDETSVYIDPSIAFEWLCDLTNDETALMMEGFNKSRENLVPLSKGKQ